MKIAVTASVVTAYAGREPGKGDVVPIGRDGARAVLGGFGDDTPTVVEVESWYPDSIPANTLVAVEMILDKSEDVPTVKPTITTVYGPAK